MPQFPCIHQLCGTLSFGSHYPACCGVGELKVRGSQAEILEKFFSRPNFWTWLLPTIPGRKV
jgi:hypothetical protein